MNLLGTRQRWGAIFSLLAIFQAETALAEVREFRIHNSRQITARVERYYGADEGAFATQFCAPNAAEVMIVDSRLSDLDGKTFFFASTEACEAARSLAISSYKRCQTFLIINTENQTATIEARNCL